MSAVNGSKTLDRAQSDNSQRERWELEKIVLQKNEFRLVIWASLAGTATQKMGGDIDEREHRDCSRDRDCENDRRATAVFSLPRIVNAEAGW